MAFGTDRVTPTLTIAIPTWNRAASLSTALDHLLPQVTNFSTAIEIVISDNGSADHTWQVITRIVSRHPTLRILTNRNDTNRGFFENLKKCRELSSGKYFWVLSDDDYVRDEVVPEIMHQLNAAEEVAVLYLKTNTARPALRFYESNRDRLLRDETYHIGLISSVVFLNEKQSDEHIYLKYNNSAFLGFLLLLSAFNRSDRVGIIEGHSLKPANETSKGINFFDIFINHMEHVIDYMRYVTVPEPIVANFRCSYLVYFIRRYYILFKAEKSLKIGTFENSPIKQIEHWIYASYSNLSCYWLHFYLLTFIPGNVLNLALKTRRVLKKPPGMEGATEQVEP